MAIRRCATNGCLGTLPAGAGKHCPRCGGKKFLQPHRHTRRVVVLLLALIVVTIGVLRLTVWATPVTPERKALIEQRKLADKLGSIDRDKAYSHIIGKAIAQQDFDYARVGRRLSKLGIHRKIRRNQKDHDCDGGRAHEVSDDTEAGGMAPRCEGSGRSGRRRAAAVQQAPAACAPGARRRSWEGVFCVTRTHSNGEIEEGYPLHAK